jgi:multicomponent Na+:H+ antiporter subunit C
VILIIALTVALLFGAGAYLMMKPALFRVTAGMVLISNAANLSVMGSGLSRGRPPIDETGAGVSDPLVQAMTLTAIVIGFAVTALLLALAYRVYTSEDTIVDLDELQRREEETERELEREEMTV